jgi:hypothetical protein
MVFSNLAILPHMNGMMFKDFKREINCNKLLKVFHELLTFID